MNTVKAYNMIHKVTETCEYGHKHDVEYYLVKRLTPTGEQRLYDNGYSKELTPLLKDTQERIYHKHIEIDYFNNVSYSRDEDGKLFKPRVRPGNARTVDGKGINGTPDGPALVLVAKMVEVMA